MDRVEIEAKLSRDRAWLIETYTALPVDELRRGVTDSEHDASVRWSPLDHLVHLAGIEQNFNRMIERHLDGHADPVGLTTAADGTRRSRDEIMAAVHRANEDWVRRYRDASLTDVIALGQAARAQTLALLARLSDEQLAQTLPGAPWSDGTIGGVIVTNAGHGRMHWDWIKGAGQ